MEISLITFKLSQLLLSKGWSITTAESCTAGGIAYCLTELPGSSAWFERSFVTYSNLAKEEMLGVSEACLQQHGAVSQEVVKAMADGALQHSHSEVSLAVSGIAGPDGGSDEKPVGTVWIACCIKKHCSKEQLFGYNGDRQQVREQATGSALAMALELLQTC